MVFITGDCHGDWSRFSSEAFPEQKHMTKDDFVIVCGDFGLWHDNKTERWWLKWLESKKFTILFVDGNHENFDRLYSDEFETVNFHGGKAHKIRDNVFHLMRGHIFELCGKKFFAFGGASCHDIDDGILDINDFACEEDFYDTVKKFEKQDKMYRINHISWWKEELPTQEEMDLGLKTLKQNNNEVDFIVTHCCPQSISEKFSEGLYKSDIITQYFDFINENINFKKWFFGHYHNDAKIEDNYIMLYEQIIRIA